MKNLVLRDIRVLGGYNAFFIILALISGVTGAVNFIYSNNIYIFMSVITIYFIVMRITASDIEHNAEPLINSMPVKRLDVVRSRYLSILLYVSFILGIVFLSSNISTILSSRAVGKPFNFILLLIIGSLVILYFSIIIPFQYYDSKKTQVFTSLFYALLILVPNLIGRLNIDMTSNMVQNILNLNFKVLAPIFLLISLIIYVGSLFISKSIYMKKEF